jgi:hypothetical protein
MSTAETTYLINLNLNYIFSTYTTWLGLLSDYPTQIYFPEISGNNYSRALIIMGSAINERVSNSNIISFQPFSGQVGPIYGYGIWDSQTNGNCLYKLSIDTPYSTSSRLILTPGSVIVGNLS